MILVEQNSKWHSCIQLEIRLCFRRTQDSQFLSNNDLDKLECRLICCRQTWVNKFQRTLINFNYSSHSSAVTLESKFGEKMSSGGKKHPSLHCLVQILMFDVQITLFLGLRVSMKYLLQWLCRFQNFTTHQNFIIWDECV